MEVSTYNFSGDAVTVLGFIGIISSCVIIISAFTKWYHSPVRK